MVYTFFNDSLRLCTTRRPLRRHTGGSAASGSRFCDHWPSSMAPYMVSTGVSVRARLALPYVCWNVAMMVNAAFLFRPAYVLRYPMCAGKMAVGNFLEFSIRRYLMRVGLRLNWLLCKCSARHPIRVGKTYASSAIEGRYERYPIRVRKTDTGNPITRLNMIRSLR